MAIKLQILVSNNIIKFNKTNKTYSIMSIISWVNNYFKILEMYEYKVQKP